MFSPRSSEYAVHEPDHTRIAPDAAGIQQAPSGNDVNLQSLAIPTVSRAVLAQRITPRSHQMVAEACQCLDAAGFRPLRRRQTIETNGQWLEALLQEVLVVPLPPNAPHLRFEMDDKSDYYETDFAFLSVGGDSNRRISIKAALQSVARCRNTLVHNAVVHAVNAMSEWCIGPNVLESFASHCFWQGEDDEQEVAEQYRLEGSAYEGVTRKEFDAVWPREWLRLPGLSKAALRRLRDFTASHASGSVLARASLNVIQTDDGWRKARDAAEELMINPFETFGYEDQFAFPYYLCMGNEDNLTTMLVDQAYDYACQTSMTDRVHFFRLPTTPAQARPFMDLVKATSASYAAASWLLWELNRKNNGKEQ